MVISGLERVVNQPDILKEAGSLGLLFNQASVNSQFRSAPELIAGVYGDRLRVLFGPQHGVSATEQDNMKETDHSIHPSLGLPVHSLYSNTRIPLSNMLDGVDTILVDLQDVGTRVYTFATTVLYLMQASAEAGKSVVILDRPNPINGVDVEGNILDITFASFVGPHPIPMRHGLTLGELMTFYNEQFSIGCHLQIVTMKNWSRNMYYEATGRPWVMPSPNMPLVDTTVVYPGQVILEGSNLSEGRGTTRPFELFGAPYINPKQIMEAVDTKALAGSVLREVGFRPTFNKWSDQVCRGFQIHVIDRQQFRPYRATLALLGAIIQNHSREFQWSEPPYEYVYDQMPIDVITGDSSVREDLEAGCSAFDMEQKWNTKLQDFMNLRERYLLYSH